MSPGVHATDCLTFLADLQNSDGGWGYRRQSESRVEPTCWAYRALRGVENSDSPRLAKARQFLVQSQRADGYWTASPEMQSGNWVTSLVCGVLCDEAGVQESVSRGMRWVCDDYPLDSSPVVRFIRKLRGGDKHTTMSDAYRGWGWTPRTSSWVEPTSFALLALSECPKTLLPRAAPQRRDSAVALLYDRMCPGGGWNCGNPSVYGVAGEPLVLSTSWALLALRPSPEDGRRALSLAWLKSSVPNIESPGSLAVASLCLEAYREAVPTAKIDLTRFPAEEILRDGTHVLAWTALALDADRIWPKHAGAAD